jgi:hypothetical protein
MLVLAFWIVTVMFIVLVCLYKLLLVIVIKYLDRVAKMPLMKWMPFYDICYEHFDNSEFWTRIMLLALMRRAAIEARLMEGFEDEGIENPTFGELQFHSNTMDIYEFRLTYRPRRKRKIKLTSREWFEPELVPIPVS